jgi:NADPH-dependent 2,4-dienoyl-CoA reductase/sulfur reductase-like enzyme
MPRPVTVDDDTNQEPFRVVIAGGGVGGLEAALALGEAGQALDVTLLAPNAEFVERPMSVAEPSPPGTPPAFRWPRWPTTAGPLSSPIP